MRTTKWLLILFLFSLTACGGSGGGGAPAEIGGPVIPANYQQVTQTCQPQLYSVGYVKMMYEGTPTLGTWQIRFYSTENDCTSDNGVGYTHYCRIYMSGFGANNCGPYHWDAMATYTLSAPENEWIYYQ